jgi:hypothetical protein
LHAAEHRALRELYALARALRSHWGSLSRRLDAGVLAAGTADAQRLADEVRAAAGERGLAVGAAARTAGGTLAGARTGLADRFLERNQALRLAVLDASHLVTLLDYVAALASDEELSAFCKRWAARFRDHERSARDAVVALAADPDAAVAPLDRSPVGKAAHGVAYGVGFLGEFVDGRLRR